MPNPFIVDSWSTPKGSVTDISTNFKRRLNLSRLILDRAAWFIRPDCGELSSSIECSD